MLPMYYEICDFCNTENVCSAWPKQQWTRLPQKLLSNRLRKVGTNDALTCDLLQRPLGQTYFFSWSRQNLTIRCSTQKGIFSSYPLINKNCMTYLHLKNIYCYIFIINASARCENIQWRRYTWPPLHPFTSTGIANNS